MVISNEKINHAWNCVYVNNNWYELDFTGVSQPYTDGEQILEPSTYATCNGDKISLEWFNYMKDIYKDNTRAVIAQTQQIQNTSYNDSEIKININGQDAVLSHAPVLNAGKVYVVYEDIAQAYGAEITKDEDWVTLSKNGARATFSVSTSAGTVLYVKTSSFSRRTSFSGRPYWSDGLFYVPVTDIIEGLNLFAEVTWNPDERCVFIID